MNDIVLEFFDKVQAAKGTNAKKAILEGFIDSELVGDVLAYGFNPYYTFNIVKVPKTKDRQTLADAHEVWWLFFKTADRCMNRTVTGNAAIEEMKNTFRKSSEQQEKWMRKILKKNLAL